MRKIQTQFLWICLIATLQVTGLHAEFIRTAFSDVLILDVRAGSPYIVTGPTGQGLVLENQGNAAIRVKMKGLIPEMAQLRGGARAIPDLAWMTFEPADLMIAAGQSAVVRVTLNIPEDRKHTGKTYQVMIWSQAVPAQGSGVTVAAGLLSRLRFKVLKPL